MEKAGALVLLTSTLEVERLAWGGRFQGGVKGGDGTRGPGADWGERKRGGRESASLERQFLERDCLGLTLSLGGRGLCADTVREGGRIWFGPEARTWFKTS